MNRVIPIAALVVIFSVMPLMTQQAPKPEAPPAITDAHRAQFFKAQLQINKAQAAMTAAQQTMQAAVTDLSKDCGEKFTPQMGPAGDPVCIAKPEPAKPAEKK